MLREATRAGSYPFRDCLALSTERGERIDLLAQDFQFNGDYLSVTGIAQESENSSFILKGDGKDLYGWVVLHDKDVAYEYTTSSQGELLVEKVPVTKIYPVCDPDPDPQTDSAHFDDSPMADMLPGDPPHAGTYDGRDTSKLQSRPGAIKVLFMDVAPLTLAKDQLWRAWQVVAASFSAFEVNVTTDATVFDAAEPRNRGKACSRNEAGRSSCGLNAFGTTRCCNVFNKGNGYYQGTTTAHELGHLMGLRHDGTAGGSEYFRGLPAFKWCPIMGANTPKTTWAQDALFQWSKGEYQGASNKEDDLAIISKNLPFRKDDIPDTKPLIFRNGDRGLPGRQPGVDRDEYGQRYVHVHERRRTRGTDRGPHRVRGRSVPGRRSGNSERQRDDGGSEQCDGLPQGDVGCGAAGGSVPVDHQRRGRGDAAERVLQLLVARVLRHFGHDNAAAGGGGGGPGTPGMDAGADGPVGGGAMDASGSRDAGASDGGGMADAAATEGGTGGWAPAPGAPGVEAEANGGSGGSGGGSGGSRASTGGTTGTGGRAMPGEPSRGPVYGGCAISTSASAPSPAGTATFMLMTLLVAGAGAGASRRPGS